MLNNLEIRNYETSDMEDYVEFFNLAHVDYPDNTDMTIERAKKNFEDPDFKKDSLFLAILDGSIVGRMIVKDYGDLGSVDILVIPEHRLTRAEEVLYEKAYDYFEPRGINEITMSVPVKFSEQIDFYLEKGLHVWRLKYGMKCDLSAELSALPEAHAGYEIISPDLEKKKEKIGVMRVIDEAFSDDMEDRGPMLEAFEKLRDNDYFDADGVFTVKNAQTEKVVGISINIIHPARPEAGYIPWLAVLKEGRRKGLGKALLMEGIHWFKQKGCSEAGLTVDLQTHHAVKLYKDCGFEVTSETKLLKGKISEL